MGDSDFPGIARAGVDSEPSVGPQRARGPAGRVVSQHDSRASARAAGGRCQRTLSQHALRAECGNCGSRRDDWSRLPAANHSCQ
jgi:hypothetical protein